MANKPVGSAPTVLGSPASATPMVSVRVSTLPAITSISAYIPEAGTSLPSVSCPAGAPTISVVMPCTSPSVNISASRVVNLAYTPVASMGLPNPSIPAGAPIKSAVCAVVRPNASSSAYTPVATVSSTSVSGLSTAAAGLPTISFVMSVTFCSERLLSSANLVLIVSKLAYTPVATLSVVSLAGLPMMPCTSASERLFRPAISAYTPVAIVSSTSVLGLSTAAAGAPISARASTVVILPDTTASLTSAILAYTPVAS